MAETITTEETENKKKLLPAHEAIVKQLTVFANNINNVKGLEKTGVMTGGGFVSGQMVKQLSGHDVGGFCTLLDILREMLIPNDRIDWVISELSKLDSNHVLLSTTIEELANRKTDNLGNEPKKQGTGGCY